MWRRFTFTSSDYLKQSSCGWTYRPRWNEEAVYKRPMQRLSLRIWVDCTKGRKDTQMPKHIKRTLSFSIRKPTTATFVLRCSITVVCSVRAEDPPKQGKLTRRQRVSC